MVTRLHLISGLPRSGSTLLCALLRQNPRFRAAMTSPVASLCASLQKKMSGGEFAVFFDNGKRASVLRGLFNSYYPDASPDTVVFDTNRTWTGRAALLADLYPESRIICCVRDIGWIIDSVEQMLQKNPLQLSRIFNFEAGASVYSRVEVLMNSDNGLIGQPWSLLREAWFGNHAKRLVVVPYEHLAREPEKTLRRLYDVIGEPWFLHDFENVAYDEPEYDELLGMPGLHKVRSKVDYRERKPCVPPDVFAKYGATSFWAKPELNTRGVQII
jgi:sulfotransferase